MAKTNRKSNPIRTHEGAVAHRINPEQQLRRSVMSCMLWEKEFYEDGESIADRIKETIPNVEPKTVLNIAIEARDKMNLRHVPLFIIRECARINTHKNIVSDGLCNVIQRADELSEFLSIYWQDGRQPLSAQVKKGLARAFAKFDEYQLAKYNRDGAVKLNDVLFLCHAKPKDESQKELWKRLINKELQIPDTWETNLSAGKDKKEIWERLLTENKLGGLAFLRNLRNMEQAGVNEKIIFSAFDRVKTNRVLPFRFISAAKYAPQFEPQIESLMLRSLDSHEKLSGKTALVVDGSGSMFGFKVSSRSEIDRFEAACGLAILINEICEKSNIVVYSDNAYIAPSRKGFALRDALYKKAEKSGTNTQNGIMLASKSLYDRIIVITDEQSHQSVHNPLLNTKQYMINVASNKNGIGYGKWIHIDGWSEAIIDYILEYEKCQN